MRLRDLSFKYKIPLRGSVLIIATAFAVSVSLIAREYDDFKRDLTDNAEGIGRVLATTLATPMLHDDLWRVYEIINSPFQSKLRPDSPLSADLLVIVDPRLRVYVSTQPKRFPMLAEAAQVVPDFRELIDALRQARDDAPKVFDLKKSSHIYMVTPILADGVLLGTLVMGYPRDIFLPRLFAIIQRAGVVTFVVLLLVIAASWYWAQRFAEPLVRLADCMGRVGAEIPDDIECRLEQGDARDEIGQLSAAFQRMVLDLREKAALEKQVVVSERLMALGRLSAGIAHEINNPLGGMLNAISTFKRHGQEDPLAAKTLSLLERGLTQIKETVAALLVEARLESHALTRQDIEDVRTLLQPDVTLKHALFGWHNDVVAETPLPSTSVRQILINLLLNAIHALDVGGRLACRVALLDNALQITVENNGRHIPPERIDHLFEPFAHDAPEGHGLGLWVTYQIVEQMGGRIEAHSRPGATRFTVNLPLPEHAAPSAEPPQGWRGQQPEPHSVEQPSPPSSGRGMGGKAAL
jgi:two-component system NtrC family sensor kinase